MSVNGDLSAPGLLEDREVGLAGDVLIDLDQIGAVRGQLLYHLPSLRRGAHHDRVGRPQGRIAFDRRAGAEESGWARKIPFGQPALDRVGQLEGDIAGVVVHVANAGDAVNEEQRKVPFLGRDRRVGVAFRDGVHRVDMHIPQAGDEVAACSIEQLRFAGYLYLVGRANR